MEALTKNKEEIEKILEGCGSPNHTSEICGTQFKNNYFNSHKGELYLCPKCESRLEATIKTSILWCEYCISNLANWESDRKEIQTHLNWLKEYPKGHEQEEK